MNPFKILIVDDEPTQRDMLRGYLARCGYDLSEVGNGPDALDHVRTHPVDLLLTDMRMPGLNGLELLAAVREINPLIQVIVMTAFGTVETAVEAMQRGAFTFVPKPIDLDALAVHIERALDHKTLFEENRELRARLEPATVSDMIARSQAMREVLGLVARVADSRATVLIQGESGTGKELVANAIYASGPRRLNPFIAVNVAAIPETLLESELFGHEKGAFTGAGTRHLGRFERASGGTLFIDEVGEMPLSTQVKLLRVLQEGQIERLGGSEVMDVDVRVVAATSRDLEEMTREGKFRDDLFYRLDVIRIDIPPLRGRKADIPPLVDHFIARFASLNNRAIEGIEPAAMDLLMKHGWPGNVRELENAIESAVVLCRGTVITAGDLPAAVRGRRGDVGTDPLLDDDPSRPLPERLESFERREVLSAIEAAGGNRSKAARILGMSEKNIRDRLKRWDLS